MDFHAMIVPLLKELHELLKQLEVSKWHSWKQKLCADENFMP